MLYLLTLAVLVSSVYCQLPSPCPDTFTYEPRKPDQLDRWYGVISLKTPEDLQGVWLHITLDNRIDLLGNWFGEASSSDNIEFTIRNAKYKLEAGPPVSVRFFVKYNAGATKIPSLKAVRLNGKTICSATEPASGPTPPTLHISQSVTKAAAPATGPPAGAQHRPTPRPPAGGGGGRRPGGAAFIREDDDDDDLNIPVTGNKRPSSGVALGGSSQSGEDDGSFFMGDFTTKPTSRRTPSSTISAYNPQTMCGTVAATAVPLISHGQNTSKGQWPWHVAMYHSQGIQLTYICGGTLISETHVVTAAHCVTKPHTTKLVNKRYILVYLGKHDLRSFGPEVQDRTVSQIFVHSEYDPGVYFNDVAVLKLNQPVQVTKYVRPCCLWEDNENLNSLVGKLGTVVGWGFDENLQLSNSLMQAQMPVISTEDCIYINRDFFSQFIFPKNYCAGFSNGTSVCNGDSGGGMVFSKNVGRSTVWQLRGLVSVGVALQGRGVCNTTQPTVFTDVAKHVPWIKQILKE